MRTSAAQLSLDFVAPRAWRVETPAARRSDPESSHLAAEQITASGARGQQQARAIAQEFRQVLAAQIGDAAKLVIGTFTP